MAASLPWLLLPVVAVVAFFWGRASSVMLAHPNDGGGADEERAAQGEAQTWTCSMHPQIRQLGPGKCPICGMELVPISEGLGTVDGTPTRIKLSESARIRAQIRTAPVRRWTSAGAERRLLGRVDHDETTLKTVTSWVAGRIDQLHVSETGQRVKKGQAIATLYSPELYAAHQDLIQARLLTERLSGPLVAEVARSAAGATLAAARDRLRLLGVPVADVDRMQRASRPVEHMKIRSRFAGTVIERLATEGSYVQTGTGLYRLSDLSRLWVKLDAYESDLSLLHVGQEVTLRMEALPEETFVGQVAFVDPVLNRRTRTASVRVRVRNRDGRLRPGMFAEAIVRSGEGMGNGEGKGKGEDGGKRVRREDRAGAALVVPASAPLFTGRRSVVYIERQGPDGFVYEAKVVRLGPKRGEVYPVLAGLSDGDRVVIHGAFALDADLQIRGGRSMMTMPDDSEEVPHADTVRVPPQHADAMAGLVARYLDLQAALALDDGEAARKAAEQLRSAAKEVRPRGGSAFASAWTALSEQIETSATDAARAGALAATRVAFGELSQQLATLLRVFGNPSDATLRLAHCPMALSGNGADWIQRSEAIENPYMGASMPSCGEIQHTVDHGTYLLPQRQGMSISGAGEETRSLAPAEEHQH